ncbi:MAG: hypothetical protein SFU20_13285 [Chitinophagaceae bacterium]|nr:hypothetical protein [Chitinophagaceae bacterium]
MTEYLNFVDSLAQKGGTDQIFFNSGPNHAAIVFATMFKYANSEMKMFCGGFTGEVSNDKRYQRELEEYLKRGGKLKILVENDLSNNPKSQVYAIFRKYSSNIQVYLSQGKVTDKNGDPLHFAMADDRMYRLETGTIDYTAEVNFNNPEKVDILNYYFDRILLSSKGHPISLN